MSVAIGKRAHHCWYRGAVVLACSLSWPAVAIAQSDLDSLVARAMASNPVVRAARARVDAARTRIDPAGARPDPMLMVGIQNFPVTDPGFSDFMTMKMVGVEQMIPFPGKLTLSTRAAQRELDAMRAQLESAQRDVAAEVKRGYYDLAYLDRALEIVERNRQLLVSLIRVTEARYGVGTGGQQEVLRVRVEAARLGEEASELTEQRRAVLARLNAALDRPTDTQLESVSIPARVARAAVRDSAEQIRFVAATLGARSADSPLPPLGELQDAAVRQNPELRAHDAMIAAQTARVELARKAHLPDFDVSLSYGQRDGFSDMVTATVSVPIPLQKRRKQDQLVVAERSELAALEAEHDERVNALEARVAELYADLERDRTQLALYVKAILPQARAALTSATANYQVGRAEYLTLLDTQATLFNYETSYHRALTDFAKTLAALERSVGGEVLP